MNILIIPDSFKGTIDSLSIGQAIAEIAIKSIPDAKVAAFPVSDGGEGFLKMVSASRKGEMIRFEVDNAQKTGKRECALFLDEEHAFLESALACGYDQRIDGASALNASSYPLGQCIRKALELGAKDIGIGLGGTITHDLGCGALIALGGKIMNPNLEEFIPNASTLDSISSICTPIISKDVKFTIYSDVKNELLGEHGAAKTFGKQKGIPENLLDVIDEKSRCAANVFTQILGKDYSMLPFTGSAGGLGFMAIAVLGASVISGSDFALTSPAISAAMEQADLIITGEGRIDSQSKDGKLLGALSDYCERSNKKLVAIGGIVTKNPEQFLPGVSHFVELSSYRGQDFSMSHPVEALEALLPPLLKHFS